MIKVTIASFPHVSCLFDGGPCCQEAESKCKAPGYRYYGQIRLTSDFAIHPLNDISDSKERCHGRQYPNPRSVTSGECVRSAGDDRTNHAEGPFEGNEIVQHFPGAKDHTKEDDRRVGRARRVQALTRLPYITTRFRSAHPS